MKKAFSVFFLLGILAFSTPSIAREKLQYYYEDDYCGDYYSNCESIVIKCRLWGISACHYAIQVPCADACGH